MRQKYFRTGENLHAQNNGFQLHVSWETSPGNDTAFVIGRGLFPMKQKMTHWVIFFCAAWGNRNPD